MTEEITEAKICAAAKLFFRDCRHDKGYPFKTWEEQAEELRDLWKKGTLSVDFLNFVVGEEADSERRNLQ